MSNKQIISTLRKAGIRTVGDLDVWRESRAMTRWAALAELCGESAADRILARLAVNAARKNAGGGGKLRPPVVDVIPNSEIKS